MAQHMIRDIQTLLSRMEVSGQGWLGSVCLFILPYRSVSAWQQRHDWPYQPDSSCLIWSLLCSLHSLGQKKYLCRAILSLPILWCLVSGKFVADLSDNSRGMFFQLQKQSMLF